MKTQILFIHGAESFEKYDDFIEYLKTCTIYNPLGTPSKRWKDDIWTNFGEKNDVFTPTMPNKQNAKYFEWKIWFERYFEYLTGEVILIGHSQGGYFLVKYLTENEVPFPIKALFLVSAPFNNKVYGYKDSNDFDYDTEKLNILEKKTQNIHIFHSKDDFIVPYSEAEKYLANLPHATLHTFTDRTHFIGSDFPEIIEEIRKLV